MTTTTLSPSSNAVEPSNNYYPYVRYGEPDGNQKPILHRISDPIPDDVTTISPIYQLTYGQVAKHRARRENPYAFEGNANLAKIIQNDCEDAEQVLYPVYVESDADVAFPGMIDSITTFIENELEVSTDACTWYYTGSRSIHAHIPRFVTSEDDLTRLRELATEFNEDSEIEIDSQIYTRKRQFRIPGATHETSGGRKVEIEPEWSHQRILKAANDARPDSMPRTYVNVLSETVGEWSDISNRIKARSAPNKWVWSHTSAESKSSIETPLIEQQEYPLEEQQDAQNLWKQYNSQEFSPYAKTRGNARSVTSLTVKGPAFTRAEVRNQTTLVPAYFHGAIGGDGEFTMEESYAPLQLSKPDYRKCDWNSLIGTDILLIGGGNGQSLIHSVDRELAEEVGERLLKDSGGRQTALEFIAEMGFEIGSSGPTAGTYTESRNKARSTREMAQVLPENDPLTEAGEYQRRAEQGGIEALSHNERFKIACRLLKKYHWKPVWNWFREQYGSSFKPMVTWIYLQSVVEQYPSDYQHITVPSPP